MRPALWYNRGKQRSMFDNTRTEDENLETRITVPETRMVCVPCAGMHMLEEERQDGSAVYHRDENTRQKKTGLTLGLAGLVISGSFVSTVFAASGFGPPMYHGCKEFAMLSLMLIPFSSMGPLPLPLPSPALCLFSGLCSSSSSRYASGPGKMEETPEADGGDSFRPR